MSAPSPAFLRWWQAWHVATRAYVDSDPLGRWVDACDEVDRASHHLGPEDHALVEAFTLYTYAVRERIDERARREAP